jgi:hypothetical protein
MDEAPLRRGVKSANARWGNTVAILTGDYLFAKASDLLADLGPEAVRLQARTFERLVIGQIMETQGPQKGEDPIEHYLQVVADKTGSLIATSARFGALLSLLLEGVLAITDAKVAAPNLIQRLQAQAASWGKKGYRLREAQLRLLLALMDPTNHLQTLQAVLDGTDGIAAPEEWAWTLPLVFVFSSRNDRLKNACSRLRAACEEHEGLYEKIWRGPPRNAS